MKERIHYIYIALAILLCACSGEEMPGADGLQSGFYLSLGEASGEVNDTRSTPAELGVPHQEQFHLSVVNRATNHAAYDGGYKPFVEAGNGAYVITATYGEDLPIAVDRPYYKGTAEATIDAEHLTPSVNILCSVANALASAKYLDKDGTPGTELFDDLFSAYGVQAWRGEQFVTMQGGTSAYFSVGATPRFVFVGTLRDSGRDVSFAIESNAIPATMAAADHLILTLSMQVSPSGLVIDVEKAEVEQVTIQETLPLEWLPKPKVSAFGGDGEMNYIETTEPTEEATIHFSTYHALQDIEWSFNFADGPIASSLNGTYTLSALTDEQRTLLASYGLTLPEIGTQYNDCCLDLRGMVSHMLTDNGETVENTVSLRVKSNNRWSSAEPQLFTINAVRPVFRMAAQQQGYAWARSLYVTPITAADVLDGKGADPASLVASAVYDISTDGGQTWHEVTQQSDGLYYERGLTPATSYLLRARIGSVMVSSTNETATTERETGVPNGDFEDLHETYSNVKLNEHGKYNIRFIISASYQNYCTFTISEPTGWATVNSKTCNTSVPNANTWYCNPSAYNTTLSWDSYNHFRKASFGAPPIYSNLAAQSGSNAMVIRNVAWDDSGAAISAPTYATPYYNKNIPTMKRRSSGKLFLGSYGYSSGTEHYNEGTSFATRPTALNGYYKYQLDGDNTEQGTVVVTLLNGSTIIGTGSSFFSAQGDYASFSVPITYTEHLLPATSLRIMFTSSKYASYDMNAESAQIKTTDHNTGSTGALDNTPGEACARGAILTVDNLTFTYGK